MNAIKLMTEFKNVGLNEKISSILAQKFLQFKDEAVNEAKEYDEDSATQEDIKNLQIELKLLSAKLENKIEEVNFKLNSISDKIINRMFIAAISITGALKIMQYFGF